MSEPTPLPVFVQLTQFSTAQKYRLLQSHCPGNNAVDGSAELLLDCAREFWTPITHVAEIGVGVVGDLGIGAGQRLAIIEPVERAVPRIGIVRPDI